MPADWHFLEQQWERLRWARLRAGFRFAKHAADSLNLKPGTYRTYEVAPGENNGREPALSELRRICRKFQVNWVWVASGEGTPDFDLNRNPRIKELAKIEEQVPEEDRDAAWRAALGAFQAFRRVD